MTISFTPLPYQPYTDKNGETVWKIFYRGFVRLANIIYKMGLPALALALYCAIVRSAVEVEAMNRGAKPQECFRKEQTLADMTGMSRGSVSRYKRLLETLGFIHIKRVKSRHGMNRHVITTLPLFQISHAFYALKADQRPERSEGCVWGTDGKGNLVEFEKTENGYQMSRVIMARKEP